MYVYICVYCYNEGTFRCMIMLKLTDWKFVHYPPPERLNASRYHIPLKYLRYNIYLYEVRGVSEGPVMLRDAGSSDGCTADGCICSGPDGRHFKFIAHNLIIL